MTVILRPARPEDVGAALPLLYSTGPDLFDYTFKHVTKGSALDFLQHAFVDGKGEFGYQNHIVVVRHDAVVGIGAAFSGEQVLGFSLAVARQIVSFYGLRHAGPVMWAGLQVENVVRPPAPGEHYIAHLGVAAQARGQGIGSRLIHHFLAEGKAAGRRKAALDVSVANPRAQALYERHGFKVVGERRSRLRNQHTEVTSSRRMEREL